MTKLPHCPKCGYTKRDQAIHGDHHLCSGTIPDESPTSADDVTPTPDPLKPTEAWAIVKQAAPGVMEIKTLGGRHAPRWQYAIFPTKAAAENMRDSTDERVIKVGVTITDIAGYTISEVAE